MSLLATKKTTGGVVGDVSLDGPQAWEISSVINAGAGWYSWKKRSADATVVRATGISAVDKAMLEAACTHFDRVLIDDRDAPLTLASGGYVDCKDTFIDSYSGMARINLSNNTILQLGDYLNAASHATWADCTVSGDRVSLTSATLSGVAVGDLLVVVAEDSITTVNPHLTGGDTRPGEIVLVEYISGTTYVFNRQLGDTYTNTAKVAVLKRNGVGGINPLATKCGIANIDFTGSSNSGGANVNTTGIAIFTAYKPIVENLILDKSGALLLQTSLDGRIRGLKVDGQYDGHTDYGAVFVFSDQCVVDGYEARNARHHITTGGMALGQIRYGSNFRNVVRNAVAYNAGMASPDGNSNIAFDTHAESLEMLFENITVHLGGNGTVSPSTGTSLIAYQSRGRKTKWRKCHATGISTAKHRGFSLNSSPDCEIDDCSVTGGWAGVHAQKASATAPGSDNVTIRKSRFENIRNEAILLDGTTGALIEDNRMVNVGSSSGGLFGSARACVSLYDRYSTGIGDFVIRRNYMPKTTNLLAVSQGTVGTADLVYEDNEVEGYGGCAIGIDRAQATAAAIEIKYCAKQKYRRPVAVIQKTSHGLDADDHAFAPITTSHQVFDDVDGSGTVHGILLDVVDANTYYLAKHGDVISFPDSYLTGSYSPAADGTKLYFDESAAKWTPNKPGDSADNALPMLVVDNYQDGVLSATVSLQNSISRDIGEDDLGNVTGVWDVDFDDGDYDNKRLTASATVISLTFAATRAKRYQVVIKQGASGDSLLNVTNAQFKGSIEQPATGVGVESLYEVVYSRGTFFMSRIA